MQFIEAYYNNVTYALLGVVAFIILVLLLLAWRNPVVFKIGLRNIPRRPSQSALIVIGLTLSTIIIVASFTTGDTLNYSVRRQAVAAYGNIDEIIAPPILSLFTGISTDPNSEEAMQAQEELNLLFEGGLTSALAVIEGGLPGISTDRLEQLKVEAEAEPLIDGVAGSILFPTIIRNTTTGQGEPLGFIFAVDDDYDQTFGLNTIEGEAVEIETLNPGVGNIFLQASNLFGAVGELASNAGIDLSISNVAPVVAAAGAILSGAQTGDLSSMTVDIATLQQMGIDTQLLEDAGLTEINLGEILQSVPGLDALIAPAATTITDTVPVTTAQTSAAVTSTTATTATTTTTLTTVPASGASAPLTNTAPVQGPTPAPTTPANTGIIGSIAAQASNLFSSFNLATMGSDLDRVLGQYGLQLRQGDIYLNRLGAERLAARPGDVLEVFIGPIPVPFRVRAIIEEASPAGALLPVVVMRLDEAQNLLFMGGKVNNVLVSNQGDMLDGVQHTAVVSKRLSELAMDPVALDAAIEVLRRPAVLETIRRESEKGLDSMLNEEIPPFIANIIGSFVPDIASSVAQIQALPAALEQEGISDELRSMLASLDVRTWLLGLPFRQQDARDLSGAFGELNQFDVITPLSKESVLVVADAGGGIFTSLFSLFGFFSVIAGILLIFLIFVMLAAERRSEMGIARAIGVQRGHLMQMFVSEGMVYSLAAATLGLLLGLGISYVMIEYLGNIVNSVAGQVTGSSAGILAFTFRANPRSLVIAWSLGLLLTFIVVTWSSWRVSSLNIVAAIRDLPDEANARRLSWWGRISRWVMPILLLALAWRFITWGLDLTLWTAVLIGITFALFGGMQVIGRVLEYTRLRQTIIDRIIYSVIGIGLLILWITPWVNVLPRLGLQNFANDPTQILATFAIGGPMIITGAIMAIMFNAQVFTWIIERIFGGISSLTPVLKTAIAYPLSTRFRTGMAMVLFAMIMATVIIMSMVIQATQSLIVLDERASGGFEVQTSNTLLSFFDPIRDLPAEIEAVRAEFPMLNEIENVGAWLNYSMELEQVEADGSPAGSTGMSRGWMSYGGLSDGMIAQSAQIYPFDYRAAGFADDAAVWQALRERDDVVILHPNEVAALESLGEEVVEDPNSFVSQMEALEEEMDATEAANAAEQTNPFEPSGPPLPPEDRGYFMLDGVDPDNATLPDLFVTLTTTDEQGNPTTRQAQVIGILDDGEQLVRASVYGNMTLLESLYPELEAPSSWQIKVTEGTDPALVAQELERAFLGNGVDATVKAESFAQGREFTRNILQLLQGFMALGLLVGIAGLGVITTRTVVERRQQVGMLRAIGYQANMVSLSFLLESSFIALTGILIGAMTGIVLGLSIVRLSFADVAVFHMPWGSIAIIIGLAWLASLLTTIIPAWQASRIYPAEALRYE